MTNAEFIGVLSQIATLFPKAEGLWDNNGRWHDEVLETWKVLSYEDFIKVKAAVRLVKQSKRYHTPNIPDIRAELRAMAEANRPRTTGRNYTPSAIEMLRKSLGLGEDVQPVEVVRIKHRQYPDSAESWAMMVGDLRNLAGLDLDDAIYMANQSHGSYPDDEAAYRQDAATIDETLAMGGRAEMWRMVKQRLRPETKGESHEHD